MDIDKVGVKDIRHPVTVKDKAEGVQKTVASINMYVNLPHQYKGTHMSRFVEVLSEFTDTKSLDLHSFTGIYGGDEAAIGRGVGPPGDDLPLLHQKDRPIPVSGAAGADGVYPAPSRAPSTATPSPTGSWRSGPPSPPFAPAPRRSPPSGPTTSGARSGWRWRYKAFFWIEDLIALMESCGSCEVFSVLKRDDEKAVTEAAYQNPMFVEDVVREVALRLSADDNFHLVLGGDRELRVHPQPQRLRLYRTGQAEALSGGSLGVDLKRRAKALPC